MSEATKDVLAERQRQMSKEGWTHGHDDTHGNGQLAKAAACYAVGSSEGWPWAKAWWKPRSYRRNLVKAGALIIAEIERLDRMQTEDK